MDDAVMSPKLKRKILKRVQAWHRQYLSRTVRVVYGPMRQLSAMDLRYYKS